MTRRWAAAALLALGLARVAHADELPPAEEPPAAPTPPPAVAPAPIVEPLVAAPPPATRGDVAPVAGALTAVVPFFAGAVLWSFDDDRKLQNIGTYIMATGFAAAPWVAHGLHRRWKRAVAYGSVSAGLSAATLVAMEVRDPFYSEYKNRQRVPFGVLLTSAMFAAAAGVVDSFVVGPARGARE